jgi:hypothetical protein
MSKQTAVNWLENNIYPDIHYMDILKLTKKAKEMEIQQIIKSNRDGVDMVINKNPFITGEDYYNETFNK